MEILMPYSGKSHKCMICKLPMKFSNRMSYRNQIMCYLRCNNCRGIKYE